MQQSFSHVLGDKKLNIFETYQLRSRCTFSLSVLTETVRALDILDQVFKNVRSTFEFSCAESDGMYVPFIICVFSKIGIK